MKKILEKYCLSEDSNGLLLMSMPTGFGKTHNVMDFIFENYSDFAATGRKIIFITNLKKNLPIQDLEKRFIAAGDNEGFSKNVLFIDSNLDTVIENLPKIAAHIPERFKNQIFSQLEGSISTLKAGNSLPMEVKNFLKAQIQKHSEPQFRKMISEHLLKEFRTKKERLNAIRTKKSYSWIATLYPSVFTDDRTILFMSVDKFFRKNTTLVEKSYYFTEKITKGSLVFIDEFDATKESVLKLIIDSGLRHRVNLLDLFLNIHSHLMQSECPEILLKESEKRKKLATEYNWSPVRELVDKFKENADRIFQKYDLHHTCKSHANFSTDKRNFLFYDYQFHHVLDAKGKKIELVTDPNTRTNWITASSNDAAAKGINIRSLLGEVSGFLKYFQRGIEFLSDNYCDLKKEAGSDGETFPLESSVRTVLNHFRLDVDDINFLTCNIMEGASPYGAKSKSKPPLGQYFYDIGFRYHDIVDHDDHDTLSKIYMYNFSQTPESMLAGICARGMVVGISATAGLHTNIGNYDLEYLKHQLGDKFYELNGPQISRLKHDFEQATRGYNEIDLNVEFLGGQEGATPVDELAELMGDREAAEALKNKVIEANSDVESVDYIVSRYSRALSAWKYFVEHPEIRAQLCLFSKAAKLGDAGFDLRILRQYAEMMYEGTQYEVKSDIDAVFTVLTGEDFENKKNDILKDLANGHRRFILSAYQTIGAGQNLQYPIPASASPVHINSFTKRAEMDIDAIYLDRPTNLLVNMGSSAMDENSFIKYLFQLEFLVENGAMPRKVFKSKLNQAFHRFVGGAKPKIDPYEFFDLYKSAAYTRFANKVLIQATGRICRTNMKAKSIHILADASVRKYLQGFSLPESVIPVREYSALLNKAKESGTTTTPEYVEQQNKAASKSDHVATEIQRYIRSPWTQETVDMWKALRQQTLTHPSIPDDSLMEKSWAGIYLELPTLRDSYQFTQKNDYGDTEIFFGQTTKSTQEVSEASARLRELMKVSFLRDHFLKNGFATKFEPGKFMLLPPIFNNIYKGALGEESGRVILEDALKIALSELGTEEFEKFDFKAASKRYVDFKLWNDNFGVPVDTVMSNILQKATDCNASRVFIINILGSGTDRFRPIISNNEMIVEVPYLIRNGKLDPEALTFIRAEFSK